jgi:hypothetical protein
MTEALVETEGGIVGTIETEEGQIVAIGEIAVIIEIQINIVQEMTIKIVIGIERENEDVIVMIVVVAGIIENEIFMEGVVRATEMLLCL